MHEEERYQQQLSEKLQVFGSKLQILANEQVAQKANIQQRWLEDLRQYNGKYSEVEQSRLDSNPNQSKIFVNITRNKTNAAEARLSDMLFPTDDRNWGIRPTPVPQLSTMAEAQPMSEQGIQAREIMAQAKKAAEEMTREIEDQLTEVNYAATCRDMIHDACTLGTGVIKGPVVIGRTQRSWQTGEDGVSVLQINEDYRPGTEYVSPWDFFPDMSAGKLNEAEFIFERKYMTRKRLIELGKMEDIYLTDQIRAALKEDVRNSQETQDMRAELRAINGVDHGGDSSSYEVWEYTGPIEKAELEAAGAEIEDDELVEYYGTVQFIGSRVIRVSINPMETQDEIYRVFNWEKDPSSIFGFGVPYLMRDQQKVMNAAWRMILDNGGLSAGPQIVVDKDAIEPADERWEITPRKVWHKRKSDLPVRDAFEVYQINNNQADLMNIFTSARQLADEETNLPLIAQGEQAGHVTKTAHGMDMLMNSANIVLRRAVKNFDDDVTSPHIDSYYNWNMQFNQKPEIKGDFSIDARGSGALLAREMQQERLLQFSQVAGGNPEFAIRTDWEGLYKQIVKHMQISKDDVVLPDEKVQEIQQQKAQQPPPMDPLMKAKIDLMAQKQSADIQRDQARFQADREDQMFNRQLKVTELDQRRELELIKIAANKDIKVSDLKTRVGIAQMTDQTARDKAAGEMNLEQSEQLIRHKNQKMGFDSA